MKNRQEMIEEIQWDHEILCSGRSTMPDIKSVVIVNGPPEKYTDEELGKIVNFSREKTARYDRIFPCRREANLYILNKTEQGKWLRIQQSWRIGPFFSETLDEAIALLMK